MNTKNNKRHQETLSRIENAFLIFLEERELPQIKVTDICKQAQINRATFYANYLDIYDLADKILLRLKDEVNKLFEKDVKLQNVDADILHLFEHIKENRRLYAFYFKLGFDDSYELKLFDLYHADPNIKSEYLDDHIAFFRGGLNELIRRWLESDCQKSPQQMMDILLYEYRGRLM